MIGRYVHDLYNTITENLKLIFSLIWDPLRANKMARSSARAIRKFDPILYGLKPDFVVRTTKREKSLELLLGQTIQINTYQIWILLLLQK